ncbi:uncharacterized protein [Haliotis cracherodii]|uniref:uncharacterized protein n=1 Tax=Haliotis cracherodii TaxID=6455 RepID=UPI0039E7671A
MMCEVRTSMEVDETAVSKTCNMVIKTEQIAPDEARGSRTHRSNEMDTEDDVTGPYTDRTDHEVAAESHCSDYRESAHPSETHDKHIVEVLPVEQSRRKQSIRKSSVCMYTNQLDKRAKEPMRERDSEPGCWRKMSTGMPVIKEEECDPVDANKLVYEEHWGTECEDQFAVYLNDNADMKFDNKTDSPVSWNTGEYQVDSPMVYVPYQCEEDQMEGVTEQVKVEPVDVLSEAAAAAAAGGGHRTLTTPPLRSMSNPTPVFHVNSSRNDQLKPGVIFQNVSDQVKSGEFDVSGDSESNVEDESPCGTRESPVDQEIQLNQASDSDSADMAIPCKECEMEYSSRAEFEKHQELYSGASVKYYCPTCKQQLMSKCQLLQHSHRHGGISGKLCRDSHFSSSKPAYGGKRNVRTCRYLEKLKTQLHLRHGEILVCLVCKKRFEGKAMLVKHLGEDVDCNPDFSCLECHAVLASECALVTHLTLHKQPEQGDEYFMCPECGKFFFTSWDAYLRHVRNECLHFCRVSVFTCRVCGNKLKSFTQFLAHFESHFVNFPYCKECCFRSNYKGKHYPVSKHSTVTNCVVCNERLETDCQRGKHVKKHGNEVKDSAVSEYKCPDCAEETLFETKNILWYHRVVSHKVVEQFSCNHCDCVLSSRHMLQAHIRAVHVKQVWLAGDRPKTCKGKTLKAITSTIGKHAAESDAKDVNPERDPQGHLELEGQENVKLWNETNQTSKMKTNTVNSSAPSPKTLPAILDRKRKHRPTSLSSKNRKAVTTKIWNTVTTKIGNAVTTKIGNAIITKIGNAVTTKIGNAVTTKNGNAVTTKPPLKSYGEPAVEIDVADEALAQEDNTSAGCTQSQPQGPLEGEQKLPVKKKRKPRKQVIKIAPLLPEVETEDPLIYPQGHLGEDQSVTREITGPVIPVSHGIIQVRQKMDLVMNTDPYQPEHKNRSKAFVEKDIGEPAAEKNLATPVIVNEIEGDVHLGCESEDVSKAPLMMKQKKENHQNRHKCLGCMIRFESEDDLKAHISHHSYEKVPLIRCSTCNMVLPTSCSLQAHYKIHSGNRSMTPSACPECGLVFTNDMSSFRRHVDRECLHFSRESYIPCCHCDELIEIFKFLVHIVNIHAPIWTRISNSCPICGPDVPITPHHQYTKHFLRLQMEDVVFRFSCAVCKQYNNERLFSEFDSLWDHMCSSHMRIRTFSCTFCNLKFPDALSRNAHVTSCHYDTPKQLQKQGKDARPKDAETSKSETVLQPINEVSTSFKEGADVMLKEGNTTSSPAPSVCEGDAGGTSITSRPKMSPSVIVLRRQNLDGHTGSRSEQLLLSASVVTSSKPISASPPSEHKQLPASVIAKATEQPAAHLSFYPKLASVQKPSAAAGNNSCSIIYTHQQPAESVPIPEPIAFVTPDLPLEAAGSSSTNKPQQPQVTSESVRSLNSDGHSAEACEVSKENMEKLCNKLSSERASVHHFLDSNPFEPVSPEDGPPATSESVTSLNSDGHSVEACEVSKESVLCRHCGEDIPVAELKAHITHQHPVNNKLCDHIHFSQDLLQVEVLNIYDGKYFFCPYLEKGKYCTKLSSERALMKHLLDTHPSESVSLEDSPLFVKKFHTGYRRLRTMKDKGNMAKQHQESTVTLSMNSVDTLLQQEIVLVRNKDQTDGSMSETTACPGDAILTAGTGFTGLLKHQPDQTLQDQPHQALQQIIKIGSTGMPCPPLYRAAPGPSVLSCPFCGLTCKTEFHVLNHVSECHCGYLPVLICPFCAEKNFETEFSTLKELRLHLFDLSEVPQHTQPEKDGNATHLEEGKNTDHSETVREVYTKGGNKTHGRMRCVRVLKRKSKVIYFPCDRCERVFASWNCLEKHRWMLHHCDSPDIIYVSENSSSDSSDSPFNVPSSFPPVKRLRVEGDLHYTCAKCPVVTKDAVHFAEHIKEHNSDNANQCPDCGLCFEILATLKKHLFLVHKIRDSYKYLQDRGMKTEEEELDFDSDNDTFHPMQ